MIGTIALWIGVVAAIGTVLTVLIAVLVERQTGGGTHVDIGGKQFTIRGTPDQVETALRQGARPSVYAIRRHPVQAFFGLFRSGPAPSSSK